jgi:hypothetical protein
VSKIISKNGDDGKRYFTLGCSRARSYVSNSCLDGTINKARVNVFASLDGTIIISKVSLEHNHESSGSKSRYFRCNKNLDPHIKRRLEFNDRARINVSINFRSKLVVKAKKMKTKHKRQIIVFFYIITHLFFPSVSGSLDSLI